VNVASRMESSGLAMRIHLSETTYDGLKQIGGYHFTRRGEIEVKGKQPMVTYWLTGKDNYDKQMPDLSLAASAEEHTFK